MTTLVSWVVGSRNSGATINLVRGGTHVEPSESAFESPRRRDVAVGAREALREDAALQVRAKLLLDVAREPAVVVRAGVGEAPADLPPRSRFQSQ